MKIAWFTPFRRASAIGRFSRLVTDRLSLEAQVDLWLAEADTEELHETTLRIIRYSEISNADRFLPDYDAVVYNLGDQADNHGPIYEMSQRFPGIVVLHDYVMHHFFAAYYHRRGEFDRFVAILQQRYGAQIEKTPSGWSGDILRLRDTNEVIQYPLFEEAIARCEGVITHATFFRDEASRTAGAPITAIPLAYHADRDGPVLSRSELGSPEGRVLVVTTGHVNENKRGHVILQALAADPELARSIYYVFAGATDGPFGQELLELQQRLKLEDTVHFTGYASPTVLRSLLTHADFCVNLRWPAMEGGSASCAEQMLFGKATIVTDTGVYSELPDSCVLKVRPEHEMEDLMKHLRSLAGDPELRRHMGGHAQRHAESTFSPDNYAQRFLDFCATLARYKPAMTLVDAVGLELRRIGVTPDMEIVDTVARQAALLTDGDCDPPILRAARNNESTGTSST
jgi:glycosyltransferase involved in cell wall biosynthesis